MESFISFKARSENTQPHPIKKQNLPTCQTERFDNVIKLLSRYYTKPRSSVENGQ